VIEKGGATLPKVVGFATMAAIAVWAVTSLNELRLQGPAPQWIILGYSLLALSAVNGTFAAYRQRVLGGLSPFFWGLLWQIPASLVIVGITMGGGASAWTIGFWVVSSVGWLPGYIWFFTTVGLLVSLWGSADAPK
jgi:hypothetical protein